MFCLKWQCWQEEGCGPEPVVLKGLCALTCRRLIRTVCEGIWVVMGSPGSWMEGLSVLLFPVRILTREHWWTQHNVEWELFGSGDTGAKLQVRDKPVRISSCTRLRARFLPSGVQEMAHAEDIHFSASLSSKMELDRLDSSAPLFFSTTSAYYLRNPLQEARVHLGEKAIGCCLTFRGSRRLWRPRCRT